MKNSWTTAHIPDLTGKTMIVTEGDSSLGYETVKVFALNGAVTVLACRDLATGERIRKEIEKIRQDAKIIVKSLDLRDPASIGQFSADFNQHFGRLDVLINIGDIHTIPAGDSARHFGHHPGSDHAGHFVLTARLLQKLASTPRSRVVNLSLGEHKLTSRDFERFMEKKGHRSSEKNRIGSVRWANLLFTYELQKLFDSQGVGCMAVAAYSGPANRNLQRRLRNQWYWKIFKPVYRMFTGPDSLDSALPALRAALADDVKGGAYYGPNGFVEAKGYPSYSAVLSFVA